MSVSGIDQSKTVEVRIMQFSPHPSSPHPSSFLRFKFHLKIPTAPPSGGIKQGWGGENKPFSAFMYQYLQQYEIRPKLLLITNRKLHMGLYALRWHWMTLNWKTTYFPVFSARQHICHSALYAIARPSVCPSVCPSVRHTGGSVKDG